MDIPRLMTGYSENENPDLFAALIKPAPLTAKDRKKDLNNVFMNFDLDSKTIWFSLEPYSKQEMKSEKKFKFFGNNPAAAKQIYITRNSSSFLNFWTGKPKGIMGNLQDFLPDSPLKSLLGECREAGLFDDGGPCLDKIVFHGDVAPEKFTQNEAESPSLQPWG